LEAKMRDALRAFRPRLATTHSFLFVGTVVIAGAQFLFMLSSLFSGGINIQTSSNQPYAQTENNGTGFTTSPASAFAPLSREEYDTYFSKPITGLDGESDYKGPHAYAGPALITFDDF